MYVYVFCIRVYDIERQNILWQLIICVRAHDRSYAYMHRMLLFDG